MARETRKRTKEKVQEVHIDEKTHTFSHTGNQNMYTMDELKKKP